MSEAKTMYVPRFGSQLGSSQREEAQPDPPEPQCQQVDKCRKKRERGGKPRFILKVKFPKFSIYRLPKKTQEDETPGRWKPPVTSVTSVTARGSQDAIGGVIVSKRSTNKAADDKKKAMLAVLKTTSRMMEENRLIRQRLAALTQAH